MSGIPIHVVPEQGSDDVMHNLDEGCVCGPTVERVETDHGDEWMVIHHSLDGRETRETRYDRRRSDD